MLFITSQLFKLSLNRLNVEGPNNLLESYVSTRARLTTKYRIKINLNKLTLIK